MLSDIEIARSAKMLPIDQIAERVGIDRDELEFYGTDGKKLTGTIIASGREKDPRTANSFS